MFSLQDVVDAYDRLEKARAKKKEDPKPQPKPSSKRPRTIFEKDLKIEAVPVNTISLEEQDKHFVSKLDKLKTSSSIYLPPKTDVLRYAQNLDKQDYPPPYIDSLNARLAAANRKFPTLQVLGRAYLQNFLREPKDGERPCSRPICQSMDMGGFRCRELLMPDADEAPKIHGWCYLCHLHETWRLYTLTLNPQLKQFTSDKVFSIHHFIVKTNQPGEYNFDRTIPGDVSAAGIYGPVPIFNKNFYTLDTTGPQRRWIESPDLLFRPTPEVSEPLTSSRITQVDEEK